MVALDAMIGVVIVFIIAVIVVIVASVVVLIVVIFVVVGGRNRSQSIGHLTIDRTSVQIVPTSG